MASDLDAERVRLLGLVGASHEGDLTHDEHTLLAAALAEHEARVAAEQRAQRAEAEVARLRPIADDLRDLVREADRPKGGMQVTWFHELAGAVRMPSVVRWARWHLRRLAALGAQPAEEP